MIIPLYKPYGQSTHQLALKTGLLYSEKATHTGTLDPAAEGVVVVLTGEDRYKKETLATSIKRYAAEILLGVATDTHDILGLIRETREKVSESRETYISRLEALQGTYIQTLPQFSAKRIKGQSYFDLAREERLFHPEGREVTVYSITDIKFSKKNVAHLLTEVPSRISLIQGNFRQDQIKTEWNKSLSALSPDMEFVILGCTIECSKRTYIRALVRDFSELINAPALLYSLVRTHNQPYSISDCLCLI